MNRLLPFSVRGWLALSPLAVFLCLYLVVSLVVGDFYRMPVSVAFLAASVYAIAIAAHRRLKERVDDFSSGAADPNILQMIWIFVLAGAFAASASAIGSVDATVSLAVGLMPGDLLPAGIFIGACFISLSIGTSVGTIVALVPVAAGVAEATGSSAAFMTAIVVGGAFFGDNLSFISDTTIAATRTQGCSMIGKFKANIRIVLPAAIIALAFYTAYGMGAHPAALEAQQVEYVKILPYVVVLGLSLAGVYVGLVLVMGVLSVFLTAIAAGEFDPLALCGSMGEGIASMGDLITITLLAGGMLAMIKANGGIDFILAALSSRIKGRAGAAFSIAALVSLANVCTANNTIAIITVGPIAADISRRFGIDPRKSASVLDTFSCVVQGILPYGAQVLMASSLTGVAPLEIISKLYYPMALCICAVLGIALPRMGRSDAKG